MASPTRKKKTAKKKKTTARTAKKISGTVKLLSGGNPQIPKGDGHEVVQAYIDAMPDWKHEVGRRLDALIERTVPDVRKAIRWNTPFYGVEGQGWFLSFHCFDRYIKVALHNGAHLDPLPPIDAAHPETRYVHLDEGEPLDEAQLVAWIEQAAALPGEAIF